MARIKKRTKIKKMKEWNLEIYIKLKDKSNVVDNFQLYLICLIIKNKWKNNNMI